MNISHQELALTLVRLIVGLIFTLHGLQKVFGLFGGPGLKGFASWLSTLHVPAFLAYAASFCELFGGLMLLIGIMPELGALILIPVMVSAIYLVHWQKGFFAQNGGCEYQLLLLTLMVVIIIGRPSLGVLLNENYLKTITESIIGRL